jgi:hypothetical protein
MNAILLAIGVASSMMFMLFFILPSIVRAKIRLPRRTAPARRIRGNAKAAH